VQPFGRRREAFRLGDCQEVAEMAQFQSDKYLL
jgi:hypothetical protein